MQLSGNTIIITGGGSGIGRALAHRLHDVGNQIIVAGRREAALNETAAGREGIATITLDADDPASIARFAAQVIAEHPSANVLINNAGIMRLEDAGRSSFVECLRQLRVHLASEAIEPVGPVQGDASDAIRFAVLDRLKGHAKLRQTGLRVRIRSERGTRTPGSSPWVTVGVARATR